MVGHLAEKGLVIHEEFREGNESPGFKKFRIYKEMRTADARRQEDNKSPG